MESSKDFRNSTIDISSTKRRLNGTRPIQVLVNKLSGRRDLGACDNQLVYTESKQRTEIEPTSITANMRQ